MKKTFDLAQWIKNGKIQNELELERALIAERKLRILAKENPKYIPLRKQLRDIIEAYENLHWSTNSNISDKRLQESDIAEQIAEQERQFIQRRKALIRKKLKQFNLTQQDFGKVLGHPSKSYISELINGVSPFSLKDLVVINRLLKIDLADLVPTFLSWSDQAKINARIDELNNPKLKENKSDSAMV